MPVGRLPFALSLPPGILQPTDDPRVMLPPAGPPLVQSPPGSGMFQVISTEIRPMEAPARWAIIEMDTVPRFPRQ